MSETLRQIVQLVEQLILGFLAFVLLLLGSDIAGAVMLVALVMNQARIDSFGTPVIGIPTTCLGDCPNCTKHSISQ